MSTLSLTIPQSGLIAPSSMGTRKQIVDLWKSSLPKYGKYFSYYAKTSNIPIEILLAFFGAESAAGNLQGSAGHRTRGLMQWDRNYAYNTLQAEKRMGRLNKEEEDKLKHYGYTFDSKGGLLKDGKPIKALPESDQINPDFNVLVGSILLGQLIDSYHDGGKITTDSSGKRIFWAKNDNGEIRLDKVIGVYNNGAYNSDGKKALTKPSVYPTAKSFADAVNDTTSKYIHKLLGVNGHLDVLTSDLSNEVAKL